VFVHHRLSGIVLASELPLPGLNASPTDNTAEVRVRQQRMTPPFGARSVGTTCCCDGRRLFCDVPGVGRIVAMDGVELLVESFAAQGMAAALPVLFAPGFGAILWQRGVMSLHAAAFLGDQGAIVICAATGVGKSTLVAAAGWLAGRLVACDDLAAIRLDDRGTPMLSPEGRCLRLDPASLNQLGISAHEEVRAGLSQRYVRPPESVSRDVPVEAIYILDDHAQRDASPAVVRLEPLEAAQVLLNHTYRRRLALAIAPQAIAVITRSLVASVPILRLLRPRGLRFVEETVAITISAHRDGVIH
jgi:hypothetical protein